MKLLAFALYGKKSLPRLGNGTLTYDPSAVVVNFVNTVVGESRKLDSYQPANRTQATPIKNHNFIATIEQPIHNAGCTAINVQLCSLVILNPIQKTRELLNQVSR